MKGVLYHFPTEYRFLNSDKGCERNNSLFH
ncbi:hypothetical protein LEMLEM_LOCUS9901 [Lemmus lemmus]